MSFDNLTPREREVLVLVGQAKTYKEIGLALGTSHRTVELQITSLRQKLRARNKVALALLAHGIRV